MRNGHRKIARFAFALLATALSTQAFAQNDHGQMQGGKAPADARDPHAYAQGNTLSDGDYSLPGPRQLVLADEHKMFSFKADHLEYATQSDVATFDLQARYGSIYKAFVVKADADMENGRLEHSQLDLLWSSAFSAYFDAQFGASVSHYDNGVDRQFFALGVQGLAPYWFEVNATAYVGSNGHATIVLDAEHEILLTQKLVFQSRVGLTFNSKDERENLLGKGLSSNDFEFRLRYEFTPQFAPYIGITFSNTFDATARLRRSANLSEHDTQWVTGIRLWF